MRNDRFSNAFFFLSLYHWKHSNAQVHTDYVPSHEWVEAVMYLERNQDEVEEVVCVVFFRVVHDPYHDHTGRYLMRLYGLP